MQKIFNFIHSISEWTGKIVSFSIYVGIAILVFEVVSRYVFQHPTVWAHGYTQRLFGSYFILIGAFTLIRGGHVRVDLLYNFFSSRKKKVLDVLNYAFLLFWGSFLTYDSWGYFITSFMQKELDETVLRAPIYPVKFLLLVGAFLISLQALSSLVHTALQIIKGENE